MRVTPPRRVVIVTPPTRVVLGDPLAHHGRMSTERIRQAIEETTGYLRQHPGEARYTDSAATARVVDGLVVRVTGPKGESIATDMVPSVGGAATAPSPGWLLRAAEASCVATVVAMRAAVLGVTLTDIEVTVDSKSDDRGLLGMDESVPAGPLSGQVRVRLSADSVARRAARGHGPLGRPALPRV